MTHVYPLGQRTESIHDTGLRTGGGGVEEGGKVTWNVHNLRE